MQRDYPNQKAYLQSRENADYAHERAGACPDFREDCDDECIGDAPVSCYNCRYRRWKPIGFNCMKGRLG